MRLSHDNSERLIAIPGFRRWAPTLAIGLCIGSGPCCGRCPSCLAASRHGIYPVKQAAADGVGVLGYSLCRQWL